jgi:hypothetical protein
MLTGCVAPAMCPEFSILGISKVWEVLCPQLLQVVRQLVHAAAVGLALHHASQTWHACEQPQPFTECAMTEVSMCIGVGPSELLHICQTPAAHSVLEGTLPASCLHRMPAAIVMTCMRRA